MRNYFVLIMGLVLCSCANQTEQIDYKTLIRKLQNQTQVIELSPFDTNASVVVTPEYQGKIIVSKTSGDDGKMLGYFNWDAFKKSDSLNNLELYGEERIGIGSLGGTLTFYSGIALPARDKSWKIPERVTFKPFTVDYQKSDYIVLSKNIVLQNNLGTRIVAQLQRIISVFSKNDIEKNLSVQLSSKTDFVAYNTTHILTNTDTSQWKKHSGLATVWSLSTFPASDDIAVFVPFTGSIDDLNSYYNYIDSSRMYLQDSVLWFNADGKYLSKIGIPHNFNSGFFGSYSKSQGVLRIVNYKQTVDSLYFNSDFSEQSNFENGEVLAVFNHQGKNSPLGLENTFYQMESMAPLRELLPGESIAHNHAVYQFTGDETELFKLADKLMGINLARNPLFSIK